MSENNLPADDKRGFDSDDVELPGETALPGEPESGAEPGDPVAVPDQASETPEQKTAAEWRIFRLVVAAIGVVLAGFGFYDMIAGIKGLPDPINVDNATLENNYRFMSALLVGAGAGLVAIAIKFEWANILFLITGAIFLGGLARVLSWALSGIPHVLMILLMIIELVVPPVIVVWYLWVRRTQQLRDSYRTVAPLPKD